MTQAIENEWDICTRESTSTEQRLNIPRHLLNAISRAESGRWNKARRANVAWPWTVTSGGKGRFFDTKAEALAEVEFLMTEGVRNIDVGCMQVNLYYHASAFESLAEALDPATNVTYGASYLKTLHSVTGDWARAAGFYHSKTPERNAPYREKVLAFWREQGGEPPASDASTIQQVAPIDHARMAQLNDRFRARIQARDEARKAESLEPSRPEINSLRESALHQLQDWRKARTRGLGMQHLMAMRRAEQDLKRKREMDQLSRPGQGDTFAQKRAQQLKRWRRLRAVPGDTGNAWKSAQASTNSNTGAKSGMSATGMAAAAAGAEVR
ncbi:MAG: transglycosylase SLT domain-containing protein [Alphaproteobacteria bacterium]|nr:transglycosylase SLT domain-containing protein [Alphaproteobacteria bacterium]